MFRTTRDRVVCRPCLKPISKSGNIRKHFDDVHEGTEPILLKSSEAHLYPVQDDEVDTYTVASRYPDATANIDIVTE